jgi:hypothetical protein
MKYVELMKKRPNVYNRVAAAGRLVTPPSWAIGLLSPCGRRCRLLVVVQPEECCIGGHGSGPGEAFITHVLRVWKLVLTFL